MAVIPVRKENLGTAITFDPILCAGKLARTILQQNESEVDVCTAWLVDMGFTEKQTEDFLLPLDLNGITINLFSLPPKE